MMLTCMPLCSKLPSGTAVPNLTPCKALTLNMHVLYSAGAVAIRAVGSVPYAAVAATTAGK